LFGENTEQTIISKDMSYITVRYFSSERLRKDHCLVPKRTGSVTKSGASRYFVYHLYKKGQCI